MSDKVLKIKGGEKVWELEDILKHKNYQTCVLLDLFEAMHSLMHLDTCSIRCVPAQGLDKYNKFKNIRVEIQRERKTRSIKMFNLNDKVLKEKEVWE